MNILAQIIIVLSSVLLTAKCAGRNPTTMQPIPEGAIELGGCLTSEMFIESPNKCFKLIMQKDGNVVLYRNSNGYPLWSTDTYYTSTSKFCLSKEGKLTAYENNGRETWKGAEFSYPDDVYVAVKDDGYFGVFKPNGEHIWKTYTATYC